MPAAWALAILLARTPEAGAYSRALIVDVDKAGWDVWDEAMRDGRAPAMKELLRRGSRVELAAPGKPSWRKLLTGLDDSFLDEHFPSAPNAFGGRSIFETVRSASGAGGYRTFIVAGADRGFRKTRGIEGVADVFRRAAGPAEASEEADRLLAKNQGGRFLGFVDLTAREEGGPRSRGDVAAVDEALGRLLASLGRLGLRDSTLVMAVAARKDGFLASNAANLRGEGGFQDVEPTIRELLEPRLPRDAACGDSLALLPGEGSAPASAGRAPVRIGYFLGVRTTPLYRALATDRFAQEGVEVRLLSKYFRTNAYYPLPQKPWMVGRRRMDHFAKASGDELLEEVLAGRADGATVGETAFLRAVDRGLPIVAVAELGHSRKEKPAYAIVLRQGLRISKPEDFKGKTLASKRTAGGDTAFLMAFITSLGLEPGKDVLVKEDVDDDRMNELLKKGRVDGALFHLSALRKAVEEGSGWVYRPMDWLDSTMSQALLVFSKDFARRRPEDVAKVVRALMRQVRCENRLGAGVKEEVRKPARKLSVSMDFAGMSLPAFEAVPKVRPRLLGEAQALLLRFGQVRATSDLSAFVDNRFVEQADAALAGEPGAALADCGMALVPEGGS